MDSGRDVDPGAPLTRYEKTCIGLFLLYVMICLIVCMGAFG